jgi:hypothetical protein
MFEIVRLNNFFRFSKMFSNEKTNLKIVEVFFKKKRLTNCEKFFKKEKKLVFE